MELISYLTEQQERLIDSLTELLKTVGTIPPDKTMDKIVNINQGLTAHVKIEEDLLISQVAGTDKCGNVVEKFQKSKNELLEEIGQLTQVHIDEPDFAHSLGKLLTVAQNYKAFDEQLFAKVKHCLSQDKLKEINSAPLPDAPKKP